MPYAAADRNGFITRSGIVQDTCVLDFGGVLAEELPQAISGITAKKNLHNAIVMKLGGSRPQTPPRPASAR